MYEQQQNKPGHVWESEVVRGAHSPANDFWVPKNGSTSETSKEAEYFAKYNKQENKKTKQNWMEITLIVTW